ncbi:hypothetical protein GQR58_015245 [Nymphon striatum]|nr:hypothetical protein GQR58_015245 [Nymphon striatum]
MAMTNVQGLFMAPVLSDVHSKRRKLGSDAANTNDNVNWDEDDDIFTVDQLEELDLLATQAYNNDDHSDNKIEDLAEKNIDRSTASVLNDRNNFCDGDSSLMCDSLANNDLKFYKSEVEKLKDSNYSFEGEVKILRETLNKRNNEITEEKKNILKHHENEINSYKKQLAEMKENLEKSQTELTFKEKERKDTIERLREVDSKKPSIPSNLKCKNILPALNEITAENKFYSRLTFDTKKDEKNFSECYTQTEREIEENNIPHLPVLDVKEPENDAETDLAFRLFNELTIAASFDHRNDESESSAIYFKEILLSAITAINQKSSQKNYDANVIFILKFLQLVINYYSKVILRTSRYSTFYSFQNEERVNLLNLQTNLFRKTSEVEASLNLDNGLSNLLETVKIIIEMYSTCQKDSWGPMNKLHIRLHIIKDFIDENIILELLKVLKEISFLVKTEEMLREILLLLCNLAQFETLIVTFCSGQAANLLRRPSALIEKAERAKSLFSCRVAFRAFSLSVHAHIYIKIYGILVKTNMMNLNMRDLKHQFMNQMIEALNLLKLNYFLNFLNPYRFVFLKDERMLYEIMINFSVNNIDDLPIIDSEKKQFYLNLSGLGKGETHDCQKNGIQQQSPYTKEQKRKEAG